MAIINDGTAVSGLGIDVTSGSARVRVVNPDGTSIALPIKNVEAVNNVSTFIPIGGVDASSTARVLRMDRTGGLASNTPQPLYIEPFEGITLAGNRTANFAAGYTATVAPAVGLLLNSGSLTAANSNFYIRSVGQYPVSSFSILNTRHRVRAEAATNATGEWGMHEPFASGGLTNTTGAYWQMQPSGQIVPVWTFNGVDVTGTDIAPLLIPSVYYTYDVILFDDRVVYTVQDTNTGISISEQTITLATAQSRALSASHVACFSRLFSNASVAPTVPRLYIARASLVTYDANYNRPVGHVQAGTGLGIGSSPLTAGNPALANYINNTAATNSALSNTAAGYATLGGQFQFAAPVGALTDYAIFGFLVPAPYQLYVTVIDIDTWNIGAAVATTPTLLQWGVGYDSTSVNLTVASPRRGLGLQAFPIGSAIGTISPRIVNTFDAAPLVINPGRFFNIFVRVPVGTATAGQIVQGLVGVTGYFF